MGSVRFDDDLPRKVEVRQIAQRTGRPVRDVYGALLEFWSWCVDQRPRKGFLPDVTRGVLADLIPGTDLAFWDAVQAVGWLLVSDEGIEIPEPGKALGRGGDSATPVEAVGFEEFWDRYPRKVGKPLARSRWLAAVKKKGVTPKLIMAGLDAWLRSGQWRGREIEYIPHPSTWLNQERYNDPPASKWAPPADTGGSLSSRVREAMAREGIG